MSIQLNGEKYFLNGNFKIKKYSAIESDLVDLVDFWIYKFDFKIFAENPFLWLQSGARLLTLSALFKVLYKIIWP